MKHKHHDMIVAWAADTTQVVEIKEENDEWFISPTPPRWYEDYEYRIKPQPKPDFVRFYISDVLGFRFAVHLEKPELRVTFDGETGKPKSSEVWI